MHLSVLIVCNIKSLQQIKDKVRHSTAVIAQLAATLWTIRETKFKSITPEGYRRIRENKEAIMALKNPPQPLEMDIPKESQEKPKEVKKKFVRGFTPFKRDLSPPPAKGAPYSILKRSKLVQQKKVCSLSIVQSKRPKNLRAIASAASLNKRQLNSTTPRSISEGAETRNISSTKVVRRI